MHLSILLIAVGLAILIRLCWSRSEASWIDRWQHTLAAFLFPPLLLLMTSVSIWGMGHHGIMLWQPVGWIGCHIALSFLVMAGLCLVYGMGQQWRSFRLVHSLPSVAVSDRTGRVLETSALFAAQVGIWNSELVVSQGLLQSLEAEQLEAVLSHEAAHFHYRDPFWFFWLGWIRRLTFWLPKTEMLWQELLLLRELRADHWATQYVDALVLAESLLLVARSSATTPLLTWATFNDAISTTRLEERIDALLSEQEFYHESRWQSRLWLLPLLLPLLIMPFHIT